MKPFNNFYIIKNNTKGDIKLYKKTNKLEFYQYINDRLENDEELTITTGLYDNKLNPKAVIIRKEVIQDEK